MKYRIFKCLHFFILGIISFIISLSSYLQYEYANITCEQIMFTIFYNVNNTGKGVIGAGLVFCIPLSVFLLFLFFNLFMGRLSHCFLGRHKIVFTIVFFVISLVVLLQSLHFFDYLVYTSIESSFIEEHYVDPKSVDISFTEKRNLIMIFVESLETSLFNKSLGGYWDYDVIPELVNVLNDDDAVFFHQNSVAEQMKMISGASYTTAGLFANTTGLPFKVRIKNIYKSKDFMKGTYALGDLLKANGYYNELISGAQADFGGVKDFFSKHGDFTIIDIDTIKNYGISISSNGRGNWGFNDSFLFELAKQRLDTISQKEEPFNLTLVTIDTHPVDGFVNESSETKFKEQYENAYATTSRVISDFVSWVKNQKYYKNTTIMIVGDHLSMQKRFFNKRKAYDRYVYNCIINPRSKTATFNNRDYTALDTFPTILYSIGANIPGNRLGLGVNLFSGEKTLVEEYGVLTLDSNLSIHSSFYDDVLMDDNYFMIE